jgi:hypothetical protein
VTALLHGAVPLAGLLAGVVSQVLLVRLRGGAGLLRSLAEGFGAGLLALAALETVFAAGTACRADALALAAADLIAYGALWYCYFNFVNLGVSARRPRLLIELLEAPRGLTYQQVLERYSAEYMVGARLERLIGGGQVVERGGRYFVGKPVLLTAARLILLLRRLILGKTGGAR